MRWYRATVGLKAVFEDGGQVFKKLPGVGLAVVDEADALAADVQKPGRDVKARHQGLSRGVYEFESAVLCHDLLLLVVLVSVAGDSRIAPTKIHAMDASLRATERGG